MAALDLKATQDVPLEELQRFASGLRQSVAVELDERRAAFRSADTPSWVHLLQSPHFWTELVAGGLIWDGIRALLRNRREILAGTKAVGKGALLDFAVAVALLRERLASHTAIRIGCPVPNDFFSTLMLVQGRAPTEVVVELAWFLIHLPALESFYEEHQGGLTGPITLTVLEDGGMSVSWMDIETLTPHVTAFPPPEVA